MFALTNVVLFACVIVAARAIDGPYCTRASFGSTFGREVPLPNVSIPAGSVAEDITIPQACLQSEIQIGTAIYVCDDQIAPFVTLTSLYTGVVHRQSSVLNAAPVQTWNYCE